MLPLHAAARVRFLFKCDLLPRIIPPWLVFIHQIELVDWCCCFGEDNALWTLGAAEKEIKVASFIKSVLLLLSFKKGSCSLPAAAFVTVHTRRTEICICLKESLWNKWWDLEKCFYCVWIREKTAKRGYVFRSLILCSFFPLV